MTLTDICRSWTLEPNAGLTITAGMLHLRLRRISLGWGFHAAEVLPPSPLISVEEGSPGFQVSDSALFQTGKPDILRIAPALPALPVVLKNSGMHILPGQSMRFFVKIPLWLQFYHAELAPERFITEYPLIRLSDTWFGDPDEGEPALALGNFYQKDASLLEVKPWEAVCPVIITNHSTLMLEVQRFIIRTENLSLVKAGDQIMTNLIEIEYKGRDQISSASYHLNPTFHGKEYSELAPARNDAARSALKINFHFIKTIYQI